MFIYVLIKKRWKYFVNFPPYWWSLKDNDAGSKDTGQQILSEGKEIISGPIVSGGKATSIGKNKKEGVHKC